MVVGVKNSKAAGAVATKAKDPAALAGAIKEAGLGECEISDPVVVDAKQVLKDEQAKTSADAAAAKQAAKEKAAAVKLAEKAAKVAAKLAAKEAKEAAKFAVKEAKKQKDEEAAAAKLAAKEAKANPFTVAFDVTLSDFTVSVLFCLETRLLASDCATLNCPDLILRSRTWTLMHKRSLSL